MGEESLSDCIRKTIKPPTKIQMWGAISIHGTSRSLIVEGIIEWKKIHRGAKLTFEATDP